MLKIPSPSSVWSKYSVSLDDGLFSFEYAWNSRESCWHLTVGDAQGLPLIQSIRLLPWVPLFMIHPEKGNPLGQLMVIDNEQPFGLGSGRPDSTGFSSRFSLVYFTQAELE